MSDSGRDAGALNRANAQQARANKLERLSSSGDSSLMGVTAHKVCCVCGTMLNHKPRFKDGQGRYWCATCNEADHKQVRPAPCADCGIEMSRLEMKEVSGLLLCPVCIEKFMTDSKAVGDMRIRALTHGPHATAVAEKTTTVWPIVIVAALLIIAAAMLIYRLT